MGAFTRSRVVRLFAAAGLLALAASCRSSWQPAAASDISNVACGVAGRPACQLELFATEPDDGAAPLVAQLAAATSTIDFVPFALDDEQIIQALADARSRGVRVRVLLEPRPNDDSSLGSAALAALQQAGVETRSSNPAFMLTHAKYAVIDGRRVLLLTFNSTRDELASRRDFGLADDGPDDVRFVQQLFDADWDRQPTPTIPPGFVVSPENSDAALAALIGSARQRLDVYAEKLKRSPVLDAIEAAAKRGVQVRLLAGSSEHDPRGLDSAAAGGRIEVRAPRVPRIHAKIMLVDGDMAFLGSENVEDAPREGRRELGMIFASEPIGQQLAAVFARDWSASTTGSP